MNINKIRVDFEILQSKKPPIYFDSACMSLKPNQVINKITEYYKEYPACAGRSNHKLSNRVATEVSYARHEIAKLIGAKDHEIIFTRNATEGINIVANSIKKGDEIIISDKEHNSNLIPWLNKECKVKVINSNEDNTFNLEEYERKISSKTTLVAIQHVSNLDGVTNPIKEIIKIAHKHNVKVLVDGCQAIPHKEINVKKLDADYYVFSGHKMFGPTGTGVLYAKKELLEELPQFLVGGETVLDSTFDSFTKEKVPNKFEAGLQDYAGIIGFGEAVKYLRKIGQKNIEKHEIKLNDIATKELENVIDIIGPKDAKLRGGILNFTIKDWDAHDLSLMLDKAANIQTRSGAHCCHSWFNKHNLNGSIRASFYVYNTEEEVIEFVQKLKEIIN